MFTVTELASALGAAGMRMAGANVVKRNAVKKVKYLLQFPLVFQPKNNAEGIEIGQVHDLASRNPIVFLRMPEVSPNLFHT